MNNQKTIIFTILSIIVLIASTAGITFAYLSSNTVQETPNILNSTCFGLNLSDETNSINLGKAYPISFESSTHLTPYTFTISNTCDTNSNYTIILNVLNNSSSKLLPYIRYSLNNESAQSLNPESTNLLPPNYTTSQDYLASYIINTGSLNGDTDSSQFELRIWIDESATTAIAGESFEAELSVYNEAI